MVSSVECLVLTADGWWQIKFEHGKCHLCTVNCKPYNVHTAHRTSWWCSWLFDFKSLCTILPTYFSITPILSQRKMLNVQCSMLILGSWEVVPLLFLLFSRRDHKNTSKNKDENFFSQFFGLVQFEYVLMVWNMEVNGLPPIWWWWWRWWS